jgi:mannosylglycerate hydrolase MGH1-like protein
MTAERRRLAESNDRTANWQRWGPYLSERQWATVREDYSATGDAWPAFTHDQARSRTYRWGEDGLLGITDRECRLCFALALWNGRDPILKERLFGVDGTEGNHGEDVKECYYFLDSTPTHSYMRALYKYPQAAFPYAELVAENRRRGKRDPEYELIDTGIFDGDRYFDVFAEYAKAAPDDMLVRITIANRGPEAARVHLLPTLWFRNTWAWGRTGGDYAPRPSIALAAPAELLATHETLGRFRLHADVETAGAPATLFTENETNAERLYGSPSRTRFVKDAFHRAIVGGDAGAVRPEATGTKAAFHWVLDVGAGDAVVVRLRLREDGAASAPPFGDAFDAVMAARRADADEFYAHVIPAAATEDERRIARQGYAGLLWSKQFYYYAVREWLAGDPATPPPPPSRLTGRNADWPHLYNRDVILMPDTWEYPWYAAWDLAFHVIALGKVDPELAKGQLLLLLREWYLHPNGQLPAYEWNFGDANPPVHAWACWRLYKTSAAHRGERDRAFLERAFQKLLINFTWWVNRKDEEGNHLFSGGFLGLDNVGVFDRSKPLPTGGTLEQADGTAWMAFYSATMLSIALELARGNPVYEDVASKFFEHFVAIVDAMNTLGGSGLWDEGDGFYYDHLRLAGTPMPVRIRSMVGLIPLIACEVLDDGVLHALPSFRARMQWFLDNRQDLARHIAFMTHTGSGGIPDYLLAVPSRERLERVLRYMLDEREFLSPFGIRSLSRVHAEHPYMLAFDGRTHEVAYDPGESTTGLFGGNSNWRGPIWFPGNYVLIEALERYHHFYGDAFQVECPVGSGRMLTLRQVADELAARLTMLFRRDSAGHRPAHGGDPRYAADPHWRDLLLFYEYFHGDTGRGLGASHQTGWTALVVRFLKDQARHRTR